jgi:hypothetical protein
MEEEKSELDIEWERRILCSDGNCIGVIGPDGKCKECGNPYEGDLPVPSAMPESASEGSDVIEEDVGPQIDGAEEVDPEVVGDASENFDTEWENRQLCSDGSCIGVIGPDGKCKECGKPFEG